MRILWVGPVIHERHFANPAVSAAASIWQQGLMYGLMQQSHGAALNPSADSAKRNPPCLVGQRDRLGEMGPAGSRVSIEVVSHLPCQSYPKGVLWPQHDSAIFPEGYQGNAVGYCNLSLLRDWLLGHQYNQQISLVLATNQHHPFDLLVSYNAEPYVSASVARLAQKQSLPWVSIIADLPKREPSVFLEKAKIAHADGRLFLSWKNFQDYGKAERDLFLEGGIYSLGEEAGDSSSVGSIGSHKQVSIEHQKKRIAYFGGLTALGGIELFLQSTRQLIGSQYEFHIIGAGDATSLARVQAVAKADTRVHYHGPVAEQALVQLGQRMDVFIDPRPKAMSENNFPSKLLTYLRFAKPVISTMGHGISPEYQSVLIALEQEDPVALARLIEQVCQWDPARAREYAQTVKQFALNCKSWQVQGQRAGTWMRAVIEKHRQRHA